MSVTGSNRVPLGRAWPAALRTRVAAWLADRSDRTLAQRMAGGEWQQRAWAAKVLGENGCTSVGPELRRRLVGERDGRVRRQLTDALATLGARAAR